MVQGQASSAEKAKVFISYSRADASGLAEELLTGLELAGFDAYLDKHDIEKGEDWEERLRALIVKADSVVYIISPASVRSPRCGWEVDRAVEYGKRLIPVNWISVPESEVPQNLKRLNYVFFTPGQSITQPLSELVTALRQDLDWIRRHTLIGEQAVRWNARGRNADDLLIRGTELAEATAWQERRKPHSPEITELQRAFLWQSAVAERQRLRRSRRVKFALAALIAALATGSLAWWQGSWLKEKYFWYAHVRGNVVATPQQLPAGSTGFKDCTYCPELVVLPAGDFEMGSPDGQGEASEHPLRRVSIGKPIAVGRFEVTFEDWDACASFGDCEANVSSNGWGRGRQPIINVSWEDATRYVAWLSRLTGVPYRLLTEAEWEYAARAGTETLFSFGNEDELYLPQHGWFAGNAERRSHPVGEKKANAFKLHDMHGNVKEWVQDCWAADYRATPIDGSAHSKGNCSRRVARGGSWLYRARALRSASREWLPIDTRSDELGFRVARSLPP